MSGKVDWVQLILEAEKKIENVEISKSEETEKSNLADASLLPKVIREDLVENENDIKVQCSPLYSVKTFEALNLDDNLLKGIYEMGFNAPSKIQETALPALLADPPQNLIVQTPPGTGKTAAFVLAMLSRVDASKKYPQVLCLSATYEMAVQIGEVAAHMAKFCPEIEMKYAVSGEQIPKNTQITEHIIIGTPGKVLDWGIKFRNFDLKKIIVFVLDEADVMVAIQGHQDQCIRIHKNLTASACQMMFFSEIYDQEVMDFGEHILKNPITIRLKVEEEYLYNIRQFYIRCRSQEDKYSAITNICGKVGIPKVIIFCHTRIAATWLFKNMSKDGYAVAVLTGDLTGEERINVVDRFIEGKDKVLITTNVLSYGIYLGQVTIIVHFDLPVSQNGKADCETYLHRICRTGRFGKTGIAINLVRSEESTAVCKAYEEYLGRKINFIESEEIDKIGK